MSHELVTKTCKAGNLQEKMSLPVVPQMQSSSSLKARHFSLSFQVELCFAEKSRPSYFFIASVFLLKAKFMIGNSDVDIKTTHWNRIGSEYRAYANITRSNDACGNHWQTNWIWNLGKK